MSRQTVIPNTRKVSGIECENAVVTFPEEFAFCTFFHELHKVEINPACPSRFFISQITLRILIKFDFVH